MVEIWGSGLPRREVMHVDDLANAIGHLLKLKINNNKKLSKIIKINSLNKCWIWSRISNKKKFAEIINTLTKNLIKNLDLTKNFLMVQKRKILDISILKKLDGNLK